MGTLWSKEKNPDLYTRREIDNLLQQIIINEDEANLIHKDNKHKINLSYKNIIITKGVISLCIQDVNKIHLLPIIQQLTISDLPCIISKIIQGNVERVTLFKDKLEQPSNAFLSLVDKKSGLQQLEHRDNGTKIIQYCPDFITFRKWEISVTVRDKRPYLTMRRNDLILYHELACFPNQEIEIAVEGPNKRLIVFTNFNRSVISKFILEIDNKQTRVAVTYENNQLYVENDDEKLCYKAWFTKTKIGFIIKSLTLYKNRCKDECLTFDDGHPIIEDLLHTHRIHLHYDMFECLRQCEETLVQFNNLITNLFYVHEISI